jgi:accessory gene regulator protein AgrB
MKADSRLSSLWKYHKCSLGALLSVFATIGGLYVWSLNKNWANWAYVGPICFLMFILLTALFERNRVEGNRVVKNRIGHSIVMAGLVIIISAIVPYYLTVLFFAYLFQYV